MTKFTPQVFTATPLGRFPSLILAIAVGFGSSLVIPLSIFDSSLDPVAQAQSQTQPQTRRRIAVLDFDFTNVSSPSFYSAYPGVSRGVSDILINRLVKDGTYSLIERSRIDAVLREQDLGASGRLDASSAAQIGKTLGVDAVIIGSVTRMDAQTRNSGGSFGIRLPFGLSVESTDVDAYVQLNVRMVSTTTGEILAVAEGTGNVSQSDTNLSGFGFGGAVGGGSSTSNAEKLVFLATEQAIAKVTTEITGASSRLAASAPAASAANAVVADVSGGTVVINKGSNDGLRVGMRMIVERIGKEVKDPATGQVLRRSTQRVGQVQLIDVDSRSSVGKILSGSKLAVGDLAKPLNNSAGN
jgi:curli biogenesis system outer membrane secretion channel CsgG